MKLQNFVLLQASVPSATSFLYSPSKSARWGDKNANFVCKVVLFSSVKSRKSIRSLYFDINFSRGHGSTKPCWSSRLCADFGGEQFDGEGIEERFRENEGFCAIFGSRYARKDSFFPAKPESLEPRMLGINPEPPYWPEREAILWANIEQKAKSFGLPLSLRMIKKKHQWESGCFRDLKGTNSCTSKAFTSLVFIVVGLQTYALHMREAMCNEDLEMIISTVQGEMYASFVWIFRQVFSRTPTLMMYVIILLANYSVYSASHNVSIAKPLLQMACEHDTAIEATSIGGRHNQQHMQVNSSKLIQHTHIVPEEQSKFADKVLRSDEEIELWDSVEDEALNMKGLRDIGLDHEVMLRFVSPLSALIEPDNSVSYFKTDLVYQMALFHEPYNTLLLCNYAQFLKVIVRDYNRAEECFKRGVQVEPPDAEVLCQYANFLWTVRKDLWGAEERYQQALAAEPRNSYYASTYANFLWSTGGEETCLPPSSTCINNKKGEEV